MEEILEGCVIVQPPSKTINSAVILLHGSGDDAENFAYTLKMMRFRPEDTICYILTAKPRKYTLANGYELTVWHDRKSLSLEGEEDTEGFKNIANKLHSLVDYISEKHQLETSTIGMGGFSMGGGVAIYSSLLCKRRLAYCVALSSFLYSSSSLYTALSSSMNKANEHKSNPNKEDNNEDYPNAKVMPILMCTGIEDTMIPMRTTKDTVSRLQALGVSVEFRTYSPLDHEISNEEIRDVLSFIEANTPKQSRLSHNHNIQLTVTNNNSTTDVQNEGNFCAI